VKNKIYLSPPYVGSKEKKYLMKSIESNWVAPIGPDLNLFEKKISKYVKCKYTVALNSGTSALHLALINLGVTKNDFVICQSLTFAGTAFPILYQNAIPIFIDSENKTWNLDPIEVENAIKDKIKINKKPKAIIAVHIYGSPFSYKEIFRISTKYNIPIIEDAAEAFGSKYRNKYCGNLGKISILSFNGNKIITTGGGGALLTNSFKFYKRAKYLSTQAKDNKIYYSHRKIGYNYRLSNILASIGNGQIDNLNKILIKRRENFIVYNNFFEKYEGIKVVNFKISKIIKPNYWLTLILIDNKKYPFVSKNKIFKILKKNSIEARPIWKPLHLQPVFYSYTFYGSEIASNIYKNGLSLPSGTEMRKKDFDKIFNILKNLFKNNEQ